MAKKKKKAAKKPAKKSAKKKAVKDRRINPKETLRLRAVEPAFTVNDLARSIDFYTNGLGFVVTQ